TPVLGEMKTYSITGAASNLGHVLQYRFRVLQEAGSIVTYTSGWSATASFSYAWSHCSGTFDVSGQARCATDTTVQSDWSNALHANVAPSGSAPVVTVARVYFIHNQGPGSGKVYVSQVLGSWEDTSVTWSNMPSISAPLSYGTVVGPWCYTDDSCGV